MLVTSADFLRLTYLISCTVYHKFISYTGANYKEKRLAASSLLADKHLRKILLLEVLEKHWGFYSSVPSV